MVEASPLRRVLKQGSVGNDWQPGENPVEFGYLTNAAGEVRKWSLTSNGAASENYAAGKISKTEIIDENGNKVLPLARIFLRLG